MLVLGLPARCQVVFERVHVRRQLRNFSEDDKEVHIQEQRDQMQARNSNRGQPSRGKNLVRFLISREHGAPTPNSPSFHVGIASREQHGKDVERYEAGIGDEGEEVVAGGATRWSRLCVADEVVDGV